MILETYDKELHDKTLRHEGYEDGYNKGTTDGYLRRYNRRYFQSYLHPSGASLVPGGDSGKILEKYDLSAEDAENYMSKYWKV